VGILLTESWRRGLRGAGVSALLVMAAACASTGGGGSGSDPGVLTGTQLIDSGQNDLYRAIEALRPRWLRPRNQATVNERNEVQVFVNQSPYGNVQALASIPLEAVRDVRFLTASEAAGRYGTMAGNGGLILVSTTP